MAENKGFAWKTLGLWVLAAVAAVILATGVYALYKPMRARALAADALERLEKGDLAGAREKVSAAQELQFNSLEVARAAGKVWEALAPSQVAPMWEYAMTLSGGALEDRQSYALALLAQGELEKAKTQLGKLLQEEADNLQTQFVQVNYLAAIGRQEEAWRKMEVLIDRAPSSEKYWRVYRFLAQSRGSEALERYRARLEKIKTQPDVLGLWALQELSRLCPKEELEGRINEMLRHPLATRATILYGYQLRRLKTDLAYPDIRKDVNRFFNQAELGEREELARFYRSIGDDSGVLDVISPKMAVENNEEMTLYLDALAGSGRYGAVVEILSVEKLPLEDYYRQLFLSRAYAKLGKQPEADLAWKRSLLAAGRDTVALSHMADYLLALGARNELQEVMLRLVESVGPGQRLMYYQLWLRQLLAWREAPAVRELLEKMRTDFPKNSAIKNDFIYYSLLLGKKGEWVKDSYALAKESPGVLAYRMTLSLALLKDGHAPEAYEVVNTTRIEDWRQVSPGWQLVRAAVLKAAGKPLPEVQGADLAFEEERALLK